MDQLWQKNIANAQCWAKQSCNAFRNCRNIEYIMLRMYILHSSRKLDLVKGAREHRKMEKRNAYIFVCVIYLDHKLKILHLQNHVEMRAWTVKHNIYWFFNNNNKHHQQKIFNYFMCINIKMGIHSQIDMIK